jgi:KDO2-lipid IV(A) lauroyltransferase
MLNRLADRGVSAGVRGAMSVLGIGGLDATSAAMASLGGWFAGSGLNRRRREKTLARIAFAFPEWGPAEVRSCAQGVWRHLGRLAVEVVRQPRLSTADGWPVSIRFEPRFPGLDNVLDGRPAVCVTAHVGNWELAGAAVSWLGTPAHALYRPLDMPALDAWLREVRSRSGMRLVDKFGALRRLPAMLGDGALPLLVTDQNAGDRGEFVPFFGRLTSSYRSVASVLMRCNAVGITGGVVRHAGAAGLDGIHDGATGRPFDVPSYTCEMISAIRPEDWRDQPDPAFYITARWRRDLETLIRRAPEQYFWMHRVWKSRPSFELDGSGFPSSLREKLLALPWMTRAEVDRIEAQSARDAEWMARRGVRTVE